MSLKLDLGCLHNKQYQQYFVVGIALITLTLGLIFNDYLPNSREFYVTFASIIITTVVTWLGSKAISEFLVKRIDIFEKPAMLLSLLATLLIFFSSFVVIVEMFFLKKFLKVDVDKHSVFISIIISVLITLFITTLHASYYFFLQWKENRTKAEQLEKATLEARFETLKTQINPHFLFNSLNTLLTMVEDKPIASQYVENLSELLRYILQTRDKEAVLLRDELQIARRYIFIQQSRFGNKLIVNINVPESAYHYAIPPLALQMLLENAIKHNVVSKENNLIISIFIDEWKNLVIENPIKPKTDIETSTGIGLANIENRYRFLSGKKVLIRNENGIFSVSLPLLEIPL